MKKIIITVLLAAAALMCAGCSNEAAKDITESSAENDSYAAEGYSQISQAEAKAMMTKNDGHVIVDVRNTDEYAEGHIPGAICVPVESIKDTPPAELPDKTQNILVYCRSGRRSKEAAKKLADLGYENVYEFGGIIDWTGEVVKDEPADTNSENKTEEAEAVQMVPVVEIGGKKFYPMMENNSSAQAFLEKISEESLQVDMSDYAGFEKVGPLPWELPTNDTEITTSAGDIILYQGNQLTIYYDENTWSFTKLGHINADREELLEAMGNGDTTAVFYMEFEE
ncbi:cyclophilin-like fold protein [Ruminococcus sp.]|uniref:cyclophilin-like fold protein n=1 Tax=Ruminococcus sp. TaxID=41978 RepID=UPI0025CC1506|nr:cyclophilin-like fold protein [Ruminococcus sp.]